MRKILIVALFFVLSILGIGTVAGTLSASATTEEGASKTTNSVVVERAPKTSVSQGLIERVESSWPWYLARASGLVAAGALIILMLSGIGSITGHMFAFLEPITAWATHRALGIAFSVAVFLHVFALYFDNFVPFNIADLLIPFASSYKPVELLGFNLGSLYVALGVIALYIVMVILFTSLVMIEKKPHLWKISHLLSYIAMAFVFVHALFLGTDIAHGLLRLIWIALAFTVMIACFMRLWRADTV